MNEYQVNRLVQEIRSSLDGESESDLLHDIIRVIYAGRNRARLAFMLHRTSDAWVNVFVERLKSRINEKWAYVVGHVVAWLAAGVVLAAIGSLAIVVLTW